MSETMAKAVCAQMSTDLSQIVPQLDDYSCPICSEVQWRPVRMKCQHIFCSNCAVKMQKQRRKFCPLCREDVVLQADEGELYSVCLSLDFETGGYRDWNLEQADQDLR
jgi:E3 ubiquitin-protein ligase BAH